MADKATVPIYCESRVAKLGLNQSELPKIDEEFEAITEGEELTPRNGDGQWEGAAGGRAALHQPNESQTFRSTF